MRRKISAPTREEDFGVVVESGGSKRPPYRMKMPRGRKATGLFIGLHV